jgi:dTDP-4-amino-4,6-dideoxygalactose transaminase
MTIKFLDLNNINNSYEPALSEAIKRVISSGIYLLGNEAASFEAEFKEYIGIRNCISVASGTDALRLILRAYIELGIIREGDEIIVPLTPLLHQFFQLQKIGYVLFWLNRISIHITLIPSG